MANGFAPAMLESIVAVAGMDPATKLPAMGFMQAVLQNMDDSARLLNSRYENGHEAPLTVAYSKRPLISEVTTSPTGCDTAIQPTEYEFSLPSLDYRGYDLYIPFDQVRQYVQAASNWKPIPGTSLAPPPQIMTYVYRRLVLAIGAVLRSMNRALVVDQATQFGANVTLATNRTEAKPLTWKVGSLTMSDAMVQLLSDMRENEMSEAGATIVGNGDFANYDLLKKIMASGASAQGIDQAKLAALIPNVYYDKDTRIWGDNQIGVFEKGSLHLLTRNLYEGDFSIADWGRSDFFTMGIPPDAFSQVPQFIDRLKLDVQMVEIDCPQTMTINGTSKTVGPGVLLKIFKYFKLFTRPTSLYETADPLFGTNGTNRYEITATE